MSKHTPGPWEISEQYIIARSKRGLRTVCQWRSYTSEADARLIAAAPDLLAALKALVEDYEGACGADGSDTPTALMQARVAIAKASHAETTAIAKAEGTS